MNANALKQGRKHFMFIMLIVLPIAVILFISIVLYVMLKEPICDYCGDRFFDEAICIREYRVCPRCYSNLDMLAREQWGCEYNAQRMDWVHRKIKSMREAEEYLK